MLIRICDLVAKRIAQEGINKIFMVSGGGVLFLTDALQQSSDITAVCCHHEQAAAMAAVGYAKYSGFGCAYVTTGCGGTNAVTGVLDAWQDSTPCLFISGQCKRKETIRYRHLNIRQLGVQEADIVAIVQPITKYAVMVEQPEDILYELDKAIWLAKEGRPGPVWVDIPMDIQSAKVEEETLRRYVPPLFKKVTFHSEEIEELLFNATRPVILAGGGVRSAGMTKELQIFAEKHQIPVVWSRRGADVMPTELPLNIGPIGNKGTRAANFAVQNADLVLVLGSRLSVSSTGQEYEFFARAAKVVVVDLDEEEHRKETVHIEKIYQMNLTDFFRECKDLSEIRFDEWAQKCLQWKKKYPVCLPEYYNSERINLYVFMEELSKKLPEDAVLVTDSGSTSYVPAQAMKTKSNNQRYITASAQGEMGFALPGSIGVAQASCGRPVIAIIGDGSFQMNIQELQTLKYHQLPIKIFIWNNNGYLSIRASQRRMFDGRMIGTDERTGISFPDLEKISWAYDIPFKRIHSTVELTAGIEEVLNTSGPILCEVMCIPDQLIAPTVSSRQLEDGTLVSCPIEDMSPFLPREEFNKEMIIPPIDMG